MNLLLRTDYLSEQLLFNYLTRIFYSFANLHLIFHSSVNIIPSVHRLPGTKLLIPLARIEPRAEDLE